MVVVWEGAKVLEDHRVRILLFHGERRCGEGIVEVVDGGEEGRVDEESSRTISTFQTASDPVQSPTP